jgi:hypothetical protein
LLLLVLQAAASWQLDVGLCEDHHLCPPAYSCRTRNGVWLGLRLSRQLSSTFSSCCWCVGRARGDRKGNTDETANEGIGGDCTGPRFLPGRNPRA